MRWLGAVLIALAILCLGAAAYQVYEVREGRRQAERLAAAWSIPANEAAGRLPVVLPAGGLSGSVAPSPGTAASPDSEPQLPAQPVEDPAVPSYSGPPLPLTPAAVQLVQGAPLFRLLIPSIDVINVVVYGSSEAALKRGPGLVEGTLLPWQGGNTAVAGHRDFFFWDLGDLKAGDLVRVQSPFGSWDYKVTGRKIVHETDLSVLAPTESATITLITCWPLYYIGDTPERLIVTAERLE